MDLRITVRKNAEVSPALEDYLRKKVERLEHFTNQETFRVEAILSANRFQKVCELLVQLKKKEIFAQSVAPDFNAAIDETNQRVKLQMEKYFKKKIDAKRRAK